MPHGWDMEMDKHGAMAGVIGPALMEPPITAFPTGHLYAMDGVTTTTTAAAAETPAPSGSETTLPRSVSSSSLTTKAQHISRLSGAPGDIQRACYEQYMAQVRQQELDNIPLWMKLMDSTAIALYVLVLVGKWYTTQVAGDVARCMVSPRRIEGLRIGMDRLIGRVREMGEGWRRKADVVLRDVLDRKEVARTAVEGLAVEGIKWMERVWSAPFRAATWGMALAERVRGGQEEEDLDLDSDEDKYSGQVVSAELVKRALDRLLEGYAVGQPVKMDKNNRTTRSNIQEVQWDLGRVINNLD